MPDVIVHDIKGVDGARDFFHSYAGGNGWGAGYGQAATGGWAVNFTDNRTYFPIPSPNHAARSHYSAGGDYPAPALALAYATAFKVKAHVLPRSGQTPKVYAARYDNVFTTAAMVADDTLHGVGAANDAWQWVETGLFNANDAALVNTGVYLIDCAQIDEFQIITVSVASPPDAPVLDAITQVDGAASLGLTWSAVTGATSYALYRGLTANPTTLLDAAATSPYVDAGLTDGVTYHYRAKATGVGGTSGYSNDVSATVDNDNIVALAATVLKARNNSADVIRLVWDAVTGATTYRVYRKSGGGAYAKVADVAFLRAYDSVTPGTTYMYKVVGIGASGRGADSNVVEITAEPTVAAPAPTEANEHARHPID